MTLLVSYVARDRGERAALGIFAVDGGAMRPLLLLVEI
jgi:hypothetical protein